MAKGRNAVTDAHVGDLFERTRDLEWRESATAMPSMTYQTIYEDKFKLPPGWSMRLGHNDDLIFDVDHEHAGTREQNVKIAETLRDELVERIFRGEDISKYFSPNEKMFQRDRQGAAQRERPEHLPNQLYIRLAAIDSLVPWSDRYQPSPDMIDAMYPPALDGTRTVYMNKRWVEVVGLMWTDNFGEIKDER